MSTLKTGNIENLAGDRSTSTDNIIAGCAKAYGYVTVSAGVPTLEAGFNVSSIVDAGTGNVTINFEEALATADYAAVVGTSWGTANIGSGSETPTTTSVAIKSRNTSSGVAADNNFSFAVHI